ncbi:MAG TPA: copper amine oxidase N-terminal domain-containing protein [Verrucomicrobiae bacterium]|jgi:hypothetical protein|nr:copper amine oxidase N-terminal domain-containing protein [Verrucomicrobiae bacterium]
MIARLFPALLAGALVAPMFGAGAIADSTVGVVVNGQTVTFDQPPIERAGRVFVPLRGVFERLGASVVYQNGLIDATGNGREIALHIGSTQATVNGQSQYLDVAPFLIGSRTLVPLRFVAQALGAAVAWNQSANTVIITGGNGVNQATAPPAVNASFYLNNKRPTGTTATRQPAIHADFSEPVQRDTIGVRIDGVDVTGSVYANNNGFDLTPPQPLQAGSHRVRVSGTTQAGAAFATGWTFATTATINGENFIRAIRPGNGSTVGGQFTITGRTMPGATVHAVATGQTGAVGGIFQIGTGTYQTDVTADGNGFFSVPIAINVFAGGLVRVVLQSTSAAGSSLESTLTYRT